MGGSTAIKRCPSSPKKYVNHVVFLLSTPNAEDCSSNRNNILTPTSSRCNFQYWLYHRSQLSLTNHLSRPAHPPLTSAMQNLYVEDFLTCLSLIMKGLHLMLLLPSDWLGVLKMDCLHSQSAVKLLNFIISTTTNTKLSAESFFHQTRWKRDSKNGFFRFLFILCHSHLRTTISLQISNPLSSPTDITTRPVACI